MSGQNKSGKTKTMNKIKQNKQNMATMRIKTPKQDQHGEWKALQAALLGRAPPVRRLKVPPHTPVNITHQK